MLFCDFYNKLRKLNTRLVIDVSNETQAHPDFPIAGLYYKIGQNEYKYLFAVPHQIVNEYTVAATNFKELSRYYPEEIVYINNTGFAKTKEKLLSRGYKSIISNLIRQGYVDRRKAEKVFNFHYEPNRLEYPRNYIHMDI